MCKCEFNVLGFVNGVNHETARRCVDQYRQLSRLKCNYFIVNLRTLLLATHICPACFLKLQLPFHCLICIQTQASMDCLQTSASQVDLLLNSSKLCLGNPTCFVCETQSTLPCLQTLAPSLLLL